MLHGPDSDTDGVIVPRQERPGRTASCPGPHTGHYETMFVIVDGVGIGVDFKNFTRLTVR